MPEVPVPAFNALETLGTDTAMPVPTFRSANSPVALPLAKLTLSPVTTPTNVALPVLSCATVLRSYVLFTATKPDTVKGAGEMTAVLALTVFNV